MTCLVRLSTVCSFASPFRFANSPTTAVQTLVFYQSLRTSSTIAFPFWPPRNSRPASATAADPLAIDTQWCLLFCSSAFPPNCKYAYPVPVSSALTTKPGFPLATAPPPGSSFSPTLRSTARASPGNNFAIVALFAAAVASFRPLKDNWPKRTITYYCWLSLPLRCYPFQAFFWRIHPFLFYPARYRILSF